MPGECDGDLWEGLVHPDDLPEWRRAVRLTRELFEQPAMQRFAAEEIQPGPKVNSDAEIDAFLARMRTL